MRPLGELRAAIESEFLSAEKIMEMDQPLDAMMGVNNTEMGNFVQLHNSKGLCGRLMLIDEFGGGGHDLFDFQRMNALAFEQSPSQIAVRHDRMQFPVLVNHERCPDSFGIHFLQSLRDLGADQDLGDVVVREHDLSDTGGESLSKAAPGMKPLEILWVKTPGIDEHYG